jgi:hypothetical protein
MKSISRRTRNHAARLRPSRGLPVAVLALLPLLAILAIAADDPNDPRADVSLRAVPPRSWDVQLGAAGDPGEPFEMSGIVRDRDGKVAGGRKVFVYHANARGSYAEKDGRMRYASTLRTDAKGRYRIRTIFPSGYGGVAPHVHFEILEPRHVAGEVSLRREGENTRHGFVAKRGRDGVWRLAVDLRPGVSSPG